MKPELTDKIIVTAHPEFIAHASHPDREHYVFAYTINILNIGPIAAQLISRHWIITDAHENIQEVRGLGVIGQQPLLKTGEYFEYTSSCVLPTPVGTMRGSYQLLGEEGTVFSVMISEFVLAVPKALH